MSCKAIARAETRQGKKSLLLLQRKNIMLKLYYKIWVDGIVKMRSIPANKDMWKFYSLILISLAMAINIALFMSILQRNILHKYFYDIKFTFFKNKLDDFLSFFVLFMLVPIILNYFLIFRNKRYEQLILKYNSYNGRLCISYILISYFLPIILILIAWIFIH